MQTVYAFVVAGVTGVAALALAPRGAMAQAPRQVESRWVQEGRVAPHGTAAIPSGVVVVQGQQRKGGTLMIVGGVALFMGLVLGDDVGTVLMIGGLGLGVWGLYLYVQ